MRFEMPVDPREERRARVGRWVGFGFAAILVALLTYMGYVGFEGSRQLVEPPVSGDCRTPAILGWEYEAINYDQATDQVLADQADPKDCDAVGAPAGGDLVSSDGIRLAGWYIPAASGAGPTGPTVVVAHGYGINKSAMLDRVGPLHDTYNLLLFDFRNHGQSGASPTTQATREQADLKAVVDWLAAAKAPQRIAVLGESMGGAAAVNEVAGDERVQALILHSTHATLANAIQARLERKGYPLSLPGSWAILLGGLLRTGLDMSSVDPVQAVTRLEGRPLLIISGDADDEIGRSDAQDLLAAAQGAGVPAVLHLCAGGGHASAWETCADDYGGWMLGFLQDAVGP